MNRNRVMYQLFLRAFSSDGTISAAQKLLPNIASLGVDIVYLCPITLADDDMDKAHWSDRQKASGIPNPQNPYRVGDYFSVDPEYGTEQDLRAFINEAHRLGMKVMLDLVYYHCGPAAKILKEHPEFAQHNPDGSIRMGDWHFPALNFECDALRKYLWKNMEYYVRDFDADGYRCDVGDMVPLDFWEEGIKRVRAIKPDAVMLNEGKKPEYGKVFDFSYGFTWKHKMAAVLRGTQPASEVRKVWEEQRLLFGTDPLIRGFDNHDIASDSYDDRLEKAAGFERINAALFCSYTFDGVPFLYNGYEVCDERRHAIFASRNFPGNYIIQWENALTEKASKRMALLRELAGFFHAESDLNGMELTFCDNEHPEDVLTYRRGSTLFCAVNLGKETVDVSVPQVRSLLCSGIILTDGKCTLNAGGYLLGRLV